MSGTFRCGHPKSPENTSRIRDNGTACRTCRLEYKGRWRERVRQLAEARMMGKPIDGPVTLPPELREPERLSPEAIGSRNLLIAYARYYERHVRKAEAA